MSPSLGAMWSGRASKISLLGRKRAPPGGHRGAGGGASGYIRDLPQSNGTIIAFYRNLVVHFKRFPSSPLPLRPPLRGLGLEPQRQSGEEASWPFPHPLLTRTRVPPFLWR